MDEYNNSKRSLLINHSDYYKKYLKLGSEEQVEHNTVDGNVSKRNCELIILLL